MRPVWLLILVLLLAAVSLVPTMLAVPATPRALAQADSLREGFTIGTSVQGQPIEGLRLGNGDRKIVVVGAIHGSEGNTVPLVDEMMQHIDASMHLLPPDVSVYFIPVLNPDGLAVGQRYNANGVDLNRNWDTPDWQPDSYDSSGRVAGGGGSAPFSEPETAAMAGWLLNLRDQSSEVSVVFYHAAVPPNGLVLSGSRGSEVTDAYAAVLGYDRPQGGGGWSAYSVTGTAPYWCGSNGIACFEVELPSHAMLTPSQMQRHRTALLSVLVWQQTQPGQRCFVETGFCISGRIRAYWEQNGGLAVFGLPLTAQYETLVNDVPRQVQWFERNRLELHPENPAPYDVLLGRIGVERLEQQGRSWWAFATEDASAQPAEAGACRTFDTGHRVCGAILEAWRASGLEFDGQAGTSDAESLALFGMPLSPPQTETLADGQSYTVQWFERARFELHPELPGSPVLLGLLGREMQQASPQQ